MNELFLAGRFAAITNLPKKTLHYYDEIGLLKPQLVTDNGYRYYHVNQILTVGKIKALRSLGMPLKEIRQALLADDAAAGVALLEKQDALISEKITLLQNDLKHIRYISKCIRHFQAIGLNKPFYEKTEEVPIHAELFSRLAASAGPGPKSFERMTRAVMPEGFREGDKPLSLFYFPSCPEEANGVIPAGRYYCCYLPGFYLSDSVLAFLSQCRKNGIAAKGNYYFHDVTGDFIHTEDKREIHKISVMVA